MKSVYHFLLFVLVCEVENTLCMNYGPLFPSVSLP